MSVMKKDNSIYTLYSCWMSLQSPHALCKLCDENKFLNLSFHFFIYFLCLIYNKLYLQNINRRTVVCWFCSKIRCNITLTTDGLQNTNYDRRSMLLCNVEKIAYDWGFCICIFTQWATLLNQNVWHTPVTEDMF